MLSVDRGDPGIAEGVAPTLPMGLPLAAIAPATIPMGIPVGDRAAAAPSPPPAPAHAPAPAPATAPFPVAMAAPPGVPAPRRPDPLRLPRRRRPVALVAVLSLLGAGGAALATDPGRFGRLLGPSAAVPGVELSSAQARRAAIGALVQRLDSALEIGDGAALASAVDPAAPALVAQWRALPARAKAVGITGLSLTLPPTALADRGGAAASPSGSAAGYSEVVTVPVNLLYTLKGWDRSPVTSVLALRFGRQGKIWRVLADAATPGSTVPAAGPVEPWVRGSVGLARRSHVLVMGDPGRRSDNERLASSLEKAVSSVRSIVPTQRWNGRVVAYASTDAAIVASWFGTHAASEGHRASDDPAAFAAEVRTLSGQGVLPDAGGEAAPVAARLAVTPFLLQRTDARAQAVLRHEVTHVALALEGTGDVPTWLVEGTAEFTAYRVLRGGKVSGVTALDRRGLPGPIWQQLRRNTWKPTLITDGADFYQGTNAKVASAYTDSWLTCLYIAAHYGEASLFRLYSAAAAAPPGQDPAVTEKAVLRSVLKTDRATLTRAVTEYARTLRSNFT